MPFQKLIETTRPEDRPDGYVGRLYELAIRKFRWEIVRQVQVGGHVQAFSQDNGCGEADTLDEAKDALIQAALDMATELYEMNGGWS